MSFIRDVNIKRFFVAVVLGVALYLTGSPLIFMAGLAAIASLWYIALRGDYSQALSQKLKSFKLQFGHNESVLYEHSKILSAAKKTRRQSAKGKHTKTKNKNTFEISNLNIAHLQEQAVQTLKDTDAALARLSEKNWTEHKWWVYASLYRKKANYIERLTNQKTHIVAQLNKIANLISQNIRAKITQLKPTFTQDGRLTPALEPLDLERFVAFIHLYGSETEKKRLAQNTELINIFIQDLALSDLNTLTDIKFIYKKNKPTLVSVPWGGYARLTAQFNGWMHLINGWMVKGPKKQALLELLSILQYSITVPPESFAQKIKILSHDPLLEHRIRQHLFLILDNESWVDLLNPEDVQIIKEWYEHNREDIEKAQDFLNKIFAHEITDEAVLATQLPRTIELLDHVALISYISKVPQEHAFLERAKIYFQAYKGEHPYAHCLLRFIPELFYRKQLLNQVSTKRLYWGIESVESLEEREEEEREDQKREEKKTENTDSEEEGLETGRGNRADNRFSIPAFFACEKNTNLFSDCIADEVEPSIDANTDTDNNETQKDNTTDWVFESCLQNHSHYKKYTVLFERFIQEAIDTGFCHPNLMEDYKRGSGYAPV